jgi:uncharacterized protein (DUF885 family)
VDARYSDRPGALALAEFDRERAELERLSVRLVALDRDVLNRSDALDAGVIELQLIDRISELRYRGYLLPLGSRSGFHFGFAGLPESAPFVTVRDYDRYIARMQSFLEHTSQQIELMREGIRAGMVMPRAVLDGYAATAAVHVAADAASSAFARPLDRLPESFGEADRERIRRDGMAAIAASVLPAFAELARFFAEEYIPAARDELGMAGLPQGRAYYEHRVRMYTTLDVTPEEVHATGVEQVALMRQAMDGIRAEVGFAGDHAAFVEHLRTDPRFTAATELDYLALVTSHTGRARARLPRRVPGHHLQIMLALESDDISPLRRSAGVTVFVEGWGLYAEKLGLDVGFYDDPYDRFGMWSYQIWRACRLVVAGDFRTATRGGPAAGCRFRSPGISPRGPAQRRPAPAPPAPGGQRLDRNDGPRTGRGARALTSNDGIGIVCT